MTPVGAIAPPQFPQLSGRHCGDSVVRNAQPMDHGVIEYPHTARGDRPQGQLRLVWYP